MSARWRMEMPCADCPFNASGSGLALRRSLAPGRWRGILRDLRGDRHFICHKTTPTTGNGSNLVCAGALAWQAARGLSSNYQRMCERFFALASPAQAQLENSNSPVPPTRGERE